MLPKQTNMKKIATKWMGQAESLQKALQNPFFAQICVDSSGW